MPSPGEFLHSSPTKLGISQLSPVPLNSTPQRHEAPTFQDSRQTRDSSLSIRMTTFRDSSGISPIQQRPRLSFVWTAAS